MKSFNSKTKFTSIVLVKKIPDLDLDLDYSIRCIDLIICKKIKGLNEDIFEKNRLLLFEEPKWKYAIGKRIFKKDKRTVSL